jgi:hypothetical protein
MVIGVGIAGAIFTTILAQSASAPGPTLIVEAANVGLLTAAGVAVVGALTSLL